MAFAESLDAFFVEAEFATAATLNGVAVLGIFDRPYAPVTLGYAGAAATRPTYRLPATSADSSAVGRTLVVAGEGSFVVAEARPDGTGLVTLELELP